MKFFWIFLITTSTLVFAQQPNTNIVTSSNGTSTPVKNSVSTQSPPPVVPKPVEKNTSSPKPTQQKQPIKKATVSPKVETPPQESTQSASSDNDGALNSYFQQGSVSATDNSTQESTPEIPSAWGPFSFNIFSYCGLPDSPVD